MKEIEDRDPSVREHAIKVVGSMGTAARRAAPVVIRQLKTPNDLSPCANATIAIGLILPDDPKTQKDAISELTQLLSNSQGIIRYNAANSLGNFGPPARVATGQLARLIRDSMSWEIRKAAAYALGRCGRDDLNL